MFQEITSITRKNYEEGLEYNYWITENNVWWYAYDDIISLIDMSSSKANKFFRYEIPEEEKCTCLDFNNYDELNRQQPIPRDFVTYEVVEKLIQRNNKRNKTVMKDINNVRGANESHFINGEDSDLKEMFDLIVNALERKDYEEAGWLMYQVVDSKTMRDILYRAGYLDKEKEELIDLIREDVYYYDDVIGYTAKLKKKDREVKIKYKKNQESTCPSWIRDLI